MIRDDCRYYAGDEDRDYCLKRGPIASCSGCTIINEYHEKLVESVTFLKEHCSAHTCKYCDFGKEMARGGYFCELHNTPATWQVTKEGEAE